MFHPSYSRGHGKRGLHEDHRERLVKNLTPLFKPQVDEEERGIVRFADDAFIVKAVVTATMKAS